MFDEINYLYNQNCSSGFCHLQQVFPEINQSGEFVSKFTRKENTFASSIRSNVDFFANFWLKSSFFSQSFIKSSFLCKNVYKKSYSCLNHVNLLPYNLNLLIYISNFFNKGNLIPFNLIFCLSIKQKISAQEVIITVQSECTYCQKSRETWLDYPQRNFSF